LKVWLIAAALVGLGSCALSLAIWSSAAPPLDLPSPASLVPGTAPQATPVIDRPDLDGSSGVFIRIFKEERDLELWSRDVGGEWVKIGTFPVCAMSGALGPKLREGDRQAPEGVYEVTRNLLNPNSNYHLAFNLGFPNTYDRANGRTGSFLMVHGACVSIGCYAMTNSGIEEIYSRVERAIAANGSVRVHAFPFRMTDARMEQAAGEQWYEKWIAEWQSLKPIYDAFESTKAPPNVFVCGKAYSLTRTSPACTGVRG
jgi:murein L,D-transpeptidase YafK